ncbi:MAG: hypothetical protein Q8Q89_00335 [bacterium]|nr:hypothetical protein [bacterium]
MLQLPLYQPQFNSNQFSVQNVLDSWVTVKPEYLWILVVLVALFYIAISLILSYHWKRYGFEAGIMSQASIIYFSISGLLFMGMLISFFLYLNSLNI